MNRSLLKIDSLIGNRQAGARGAEPCAHRASDEAGVALIAVLLIMSLMLMLGLAVTFTSVSDKFITSNFKNLTSGFYAAEAGISNMHRLLRSEQLVTGSLPEVPVVTPGQPTLNPADFTVAAERLFNKKEAFPNNAAYRTKISISDIRTPYPADDNNPAHAGNRVKYINPVYPRLGQIEPYSVSYKLESLGEGIEGLNGNVRLVEEGVVDFKLYVRADGGGIRVGSFAEFALFHDHFNPYNPEGPFIYQGLGPGDRFSGRIHTNERFGFWTTADGSNAPVFRGYVTQAYGSASYYRHGAGVPPAPVDADSQVVDGVLVAPKFLAGFDRGVSPIPPTGNAFDQARAVLDGGFTLSPGTPTDGELHTALRSANDLSAALPSPKNPDSITPTLPRGVYVPTNGETFDGSGLYIMGDADDVQLSADPAGNRQIMKVKQGNQTTTVTIDMDAGTTTIDAGKGARTLRGVPLDRSIVKKGNRSAASLYVYGSVNSLRGPGRDPDGQPIAAIDTNFAVTVTAGGVPSGSPGKPVSGGSVTITGDITYETPVVDAAGNSINPDAANTLGIYASGGDINIPLDGTAPDNLTVHASVAAFELRDEQGNPVLGPNGRPAGGRIRSDVANNLGSPYRGNFILVGGAQSSNYDNLGYYDGNFHGYMYKGVWDPRYDQGQSPPFYPGYVVDDGGPIGTPEITARTNSPKILSYKRLYYGSAQPAEK